MERRKVLFTDSTVGYVQLIITDAPEAEIEKWCRTYNQIISDGGYIEPFYSLKTSYYVHEVYYSEDSNYKEDIDLILFDESYDYGNYMPSALVTDNDIMRSMDNAYRAVVEISRKSLVEKLGNAAFIMKLIINHQNELVNTPNDKQIFSLEEWIDYLSDKILRME